MPNDPPAPRAPVVIVGAGMAGLTCATSLHAAGLPVAVYEGSDGVGGRVRSHRDDGGFLIDRGFQVMLEAYPALRRQVDLASLDLGRFDRGAMVWSGRRLLPLADPRRHPAAIVRDLTATVFPLADKARLAAFAWKALTSPWQSANEASGPVGDDESGLAALRRVGFGDAFIDRFARPFWGGISLDPSLGGSAGALRFTLKMFLEGDAVLPAEGVQAVSDSLARRLPAGAVTLDAPVERIAIEDGRVVGVVVGGGTVPASTVVVATDPPAAKRLTGVASIPDRGLGCVTVFLSGARPSGLGKRLAIDGTGGLAVNHLAPLSGVQPSYAPAGRQLLAAVLLGEAWQAEADDEKIAHAALADAAALLGHDPSDWAARHVVRVPFSQFAQPPGIFGGLPTTRTGTPGLYLAGEATVDSSVNGAILSGEHAAQAVLDDVRRGRR